ncbi:MAG: 3-phenylpropionate/trans-cinnamate dioxygenase ferredoxin component [Actinomycetota bacterium]|nr:3-phenylpropionate/trans-cinnamate dioxygenase ferredoxin component [Actinomycetota bacterium]
MSGVFAVRLSELAEGSVVKVVLKDVPVAVVRCDDGTVHAVGDTCTHADVSLSEGEVDGCTLECWMHGARFDVRTGEPLALPATRPVPVFPVTLDGDDVLVDVTTTLGEAPTPVAHAGKES